LGDCDTEVAMGWLKTFGMIVVLAAAPALTGFAAPADARVVEGVIGRGEAQIVGITAEQAKLLALQRARADAIEQAAGVRILGSTLIKDGLLVGEFLKTFSRGFIVKEDPIWGGRMIPQEKGPPLANYSVEIKASVVLPEKHLDTGFLVDAELDRPIYVSGDCVTVRIRASREAHVGVFNLRADDMVVMLHPGRDMKFANVIEAHRDYCFPSPGSGLQLEMNTLEGHERDNEAFFVVAVPATEGSSFRFADYFEWGKEYSVPNFFDIYSRFAEKAAEKILPYEVRAKQKK
jgi:hypothetical protein